MTHEENNIGGRAELPGSDEHKVSRLLSTLKRVEAPKDFDFHLKAKIAKGRPTEVSGGSLFPILKYAVPLVLFLVVGAGIVLINSYEPGNGSVAVAPPAGSEPGPAPPSVTGPESAQPTEKVTTPSNILVAGSTPDMETPVRDNTPNGRGPVRVERPRNERSVDGSRDIGGGNSATQFTVTNSNSQRVANQSSTNQASTPRTENVGDALRTMGIDAELDGNTWAVKNVSAGSLGSGMGVKPGDRVEAIDGKPVDRNTTFKGAFKVSNMSVRRDGNIVELKPQH